MSTINHTQTELKRAYDLVKQDLFNSFIKAKNNEIIRFSTLGSFKKTEHQTPISALPKHEGNSYVYYKLKFTPFSQLKSELNKSLIKKYKR